MLAAARANPGLVTQIVPSPMTLKCDKTIQRLLAASALGDVLYIDVRGLSGAKLDRERPMHWRNSIELSGLNTMSMGIFYEAVRRWLGDTTVRAVQGRLSARSVFLIKSILCGIFV